jgi:hypothetical protein
MDKKRFPKTNIASPRIHLPARTRSVALNVRATPEQYRRWQRAADYAGRSLSAWVARSLDGLAGGYPRVLEVLDKFAARHEGRMPLGNLRQVLERRWGWTDSEVNEALLCLAEEGLVILLASPHPWLEDPLLRQRGFRNPEGALIIAVSLGIGPPPRPAKRTSLQWSFPG